MNLHFYPVYKFTTCVLSKHRAVFVLTASSVHLLYKKKIDFSLKIPESIYWQHAESSSSKRSGQALQLLMSTITLHKGSTQPSPDT